MRGKCRIVAPGKNAGFESDRSGPAAERERERERMRESKKEGGKYRERGGGGRARVFM